MKSSGLKLPLAVLMMASFVSPAFAADEQLKSDITEIKNRLTALEEGQKEIIAKEGKILEELDRVRIWVHKR
jgi:hypothetical protein